MRHKLEGGGAVGASEGPAGGGAGMADGGGAGEADGAGGGGGAEGDRGTKHDVGEQGTLPRKHGKSAAKHVAPDGAHSPTTLTNAALAAELPGKPTPSHEHSVTG